MFLCLVLKPSDNQNLGLPEQEADSRHSDDGERVTIVTSSPSPETRGRNVPSQVSSSEHVFSGGLTWSSKQAAPSSLCPPAALPWNALRPSADGVWPGVFEGSRQHCEQTGAGEEEDRSEGSRRGGEHRLVLVQPPGCVPSAQCQIPSLASVSPWVPVGIITWLLLPGGLFRLTN